MNRHLTLIPLVTLTACASLPEAPIDGAVAQLAIECLDRHDAYASGDPVALAESALVRAVMPDPQAGALLLPILDRHDAFVRADETLDALARDTYLASSALLRQYIAEGTPAS